MPLDSKAGMHRASCVATLDCLSTILIFNYFMQVMILVSLLTMSTLRNITKPKPGASLYSDEKQVYRTDRLTIRFPNPALGFAACHLLSIGAISIRYKGAVT